ncbi:DUF6544 family protein [uncultured Croceitalea sp.]|uniref:DUF6544 family protein n=1 Tax=uncultured Croceitalea sp. TaxID=1798908 RepID=UPI00374E9FD9
MLFIIGIFILIALPLILFYGHYHFYRSVEKEVGIMFNINGKKETIITENDLELLPQQLKEYLTKVGIVGTCKDCNVTFKQVGRIKTSQGKKWTNFTATQYMTATLPNFIWAARAFPMFIRDKSCNGQGEVKVSLLGLKDIAKTNDKKTDKSALVRCLGELIFYPIGFLSEAISWKVQPNNSLKAIVKIDKTQVEGIFYFNDEGLLHKFEAKRYMDQTLEDFTGIAEDYKLIGGLFIPSKMKAIWNLKEGDFEYYNSTITYYNID